MFTFLSYLNPFSYSNSTTPITSNIPSDIKTDDIKGNVVVITQDQIIDAMKKLRRNSNPELVIGVAGFENLNLTKDEKTNTNKQRLQSQRSLSTASNCSTNGISFLEELKLTVEEKAMKKSQESLIPIGPPIVNTVKFPILHEVGKDNIKLNLNNYILDDAKKSLKKVDMSNEKKRVFNSQIDEMIIKTQLYIRQVVQPEGCDFE